MEPVYYPRLLRRVQASLIDSLVLSFALMAAFFIAGTVTAPLAKAAFVIGAVVAVEPALVSFAGGTIGHYMLGLRVVKSNGAGRLNIIVACWRFVVKTVAGWFSLIVVLTSKKHQALHDLLAGSLVVYKTTVAAVPTREKLTDRTSLHELYVMPSVLRRILVVSTYLVAALFVSSIASGLLLDDRCLSQRVCGVADEVVQTIVSIAWLVCSCAVIVLGVRGQLFGCRRKARVTDTLAA